MISMYQNITGKFLALEGFVQLFFGGYSRHFLCLLFECVLLYGPLGFLLTVNIY